MNGASGTTSVAAARGLPPNKGVSVAPSGGRRTEREGADSGHDGALAIAQAAVSESLGESGFVDITAPLTTRVTGSRQSSPTQEEAGDLQPGALEGLVLAIKMRITADAEQSVQGQAHIRPEAAVALLT